MAAASLAKAGVPSLWMMYRALSDAVVVVHLGFIVFVAAGGFLVWRWRWLVWLHVPCVVWGAAIVVIGFECPLTPLEKELRELGGEAAYEGGFVDRYVEDVVYPEEYTPHLRALAVLLIIAAYSRILWGRSASTGPSGSRQQAMDANRYLVSTDGENFAHPDDAALTSSASGGRPTRARTAGTRRSAGRRTR